MRELPSGTVTFLFTDIEGSTRLLHELGDRYAAVLAEHRQTLRKVFAAHDGVEVDTQGDYALAGRLWGAVEAEAARGSIAGWNPDSQHLGPVRRLYWQGAFEGGRAPVRRWRSTTR